MTGVVRTERAFSLVEVVIAIAVVTVGIISILAMFGVSFTAVRDVTNQGEAFGVAQALPAYLQTAGFTNVYAGIQAGTATNTYAYTATNDVIVLDTNGAADMSASAIALRTGRLFNISLSLSTNAPVVTSTNLATAPAYAPTGMPASGLPSGSGYGDAYLPINVKIYSISQIPGPASMTNSLPVLNYDTVLPR